ncbi:MAG: sigma-70 family RNA polymerase sigma factor [Acidobacteriia bacterium]|nr:sigma-70 family RNA polymerase sigma factor [Terriglobia bacterium]
MTPAPGKAKIGPSKNSSDSRLVEECLQGKEAAWSALIAKYKNLIFSIPVRYGFSEEDSADIFQAVCMDLLTQLSSLRESNALAGWLIQVTRNKCFHRKQAQQHLKVQEIDDLDSYASPEEPADLALQVQREQMLREALLDLSPRCQRLMHMLFFEVPARPYQQVAQDLELAEGSIGFIRRRCLNKLRDRLEKMGYPLL